MISVAAREALEEAAALLDEPVGGEEHERVRLWCEVQTRLGQVEGVTGDLVGADARLSGVLARARRRPGAYRRDRDCCSCGPRNDSS